MSAARRLRLHIAPRPPNSHPRAALPHSAAPPLPRDGVGRGVGGVAGAAPRLCGAFRAGSGLRALPPPPTPHTYTQRPLGGGGEGTAGRGTAQARSRGGGPRGARCGAGSGGAGLRAGNGDTRSASGHCAARGDVCAVRRQRPRGPPSPAGVRALLRIVQCSIIASVCVAGLCAVRGGSAAVLAVCNAQ